MCIFFFKQKTAYEMRISDWSSDVCSSDLAEGIAQVDDQLGSALRLAPAGLLADAHQEMQRQRDAAAEQDGSQRQLPRHQGGDEAVDHRLYQVGDRKSTRLNSSH